MGAPHVQSHPDDAHQRGLGATRPNFLQSLALNLHSFAALHE